MWSNSEGVAMAAQVRIHVGRLSTVWEVETPEAAPENDEALKSGLERMPEVAYADRSYGAISLDVSADADSSPHGQYVLGAILNCFRLYGYSMKEVVGA